MRQGTGEDSRCRKTSGFYHRGISPNVGQQRATRRSDINEAPQLARTRMWYFSTKSPHRSGHQVRRGAVTNDCKVGEGGRGWSEERVKPRGFLRKLSPAPATHKSETAIRATAASSAGCSNRNDRKVGDAWPWRCPMSVSHCSNPGASFASSVQPQPPGGAKPQSVTAAGSAGTAEMA